MAQKEVIEEMSKIAGIPISSAKEILNLSGQAILNVLQRDKSVTVVGIGKISISERKERISKLKGVEYTAPAKKAPKFSFSKNIKDIVEKL